MDRRTWLLGSLGVLAAPLGAEAQVSGRVPRVGYLGGVPGARPWPLEQGLKELGWENGRNVVVEWRWDQEDLARLPTLVAELVRLNVDVIVAGDEVRVNAVRQA